MSGRERDEFDDTALLRALRAPGTREELAREADYLRLFRTAAAPSRHRSLWGRLGAGGTAVVAAITLSGGVAAAAYTNVLPEPVQRIAHGVLGGIGVPSVAERSPGAVATSPAPAGDASATDAPVADPGDPRSGSDPTTGPEATPTPDGPGAGPRGPDPSPQGPETVPQAPSPTGVPTPTAQPTPGKPDDKPKPTVTGESPRGPATDVTLTAPAARVAAGSTVTLSGRVTDADGQGVADRPVSLMVRVRGGGWSESASATTGTDGSVSLTLQVEENVTVQLRSGPGLTSGSQVIESLPTLDAAATQETVTVDVTGGFAGDRVVLYRLEGGGRVRVGQESLDGAGRVTFDVGGKKGGPGSYVVEVPATLRHAAAERGLQVPA